MATSQEETKVEISSSRLTTFCHRSYWNYQEIIPILWKSCTVPKHGHLLTQEDALKRGVPPGPKFLQLKGGDLNLKLGGAFKYVLCSPLFGEDFQFDWHIFQMGWLVQPPTIKKNELSRVNSAGKDISINFPPIPTPGSERNISDIPISLPKM